jgi:hypothetical protein
MRQVIRQIGVVIGLTIVLTFPVTVVSGAGSQKHADQAVHVARINVKVPAPLQGVSAVGETPYSSRAIGHELRRR